MGIDLKKEIKLSDLFKRGPKEPKTEKPPKEPKAKKEPKAPKEPRERRFGRSKPAKEPKEPVAALDPKAGPPLRDIPLMRAFNLLPKEEVHAATEGKPSPLPHVIVALAGVLAFAALAAFYLSSSAGVTSKSSQLDDLRSELAALQVPEKQPQTGGTNGPDFESERAARTAALSAALADRLAWDRVLRELALVLPSDVTLTSLDGTSPSPGSASAATDSAVSTFRITGNSTSQAGVARLLSRLQVIPELSSVQLEYATASNNADEPSVVTFSINAGLRQQGAA
jgi:Tfp pilus assembly protein PilN